jgi:hypothetical protein
LRERLELKSLWVSGTCVCVSVGGLPLLAGFDYDTFRLCFVPISLSFTLARSLTHTQTHLYIYITRDPLNVCVGADQARFDRLRTVEIKHGRIAMMAIVGHMATTAGMRMPGLEAVPSGLKALQACPKEVLAQVAASIVVLEVAVMVDKGKGEYPGDLRNGMFKWNASPAEQKEKRSIELNNGRAAQMGILGLMFHEQMTGEPYILNAFLGYPTV